MRQATTMLERCWERDVRNMTNYYGQFAPELRKGHYAKEIWKLFEKGELKPNTKINRYGNVRYQARPMLIL